MAELANLHAEHLDLLREVGNIGSGHAATALSRLLNGRVDIRVPIATVQPLAEAVELLGGAEVEAVGVVQAVEGDLNGYLHFLYPMSSARMLVERLLRRPVTTFGEMEISVMCEIANILSGAYLAALATMARLRLYTSPPTDACDMTGALLDGTLAAVSDADDRVLLIETEFVIEEHVLGVHLLFLPSRGELSRLLTAFGMAP